MAVIKHGAEGVAVHQAGKPVYSVAPMDVVAQSTIGSGDVFAGALAASLAAGSAVDEAAEHANTVAATAIASIDLVYGADFADRRAKLNAS